MKVVIHLYHGRISPSEELEDWGADGPLLGPFDGFHMTYLSHLRTIIDGVNQADLKMVGDLIYYDGMYYGDMVVLSEEAASDTFGYADKKIEMIDEGKCKLPVK